MLTISNTGLSGPDPIIYKLQPYSWNSATTQCKVNVICDYTQISQYMTCETTHISTTTAGIISNILSPKMLENITILLTVEKKIVSHKNDLVAR